MSRLLPENDGPVIYDKAVRQALAEDAEDLKSFRDRAKEPRMSFEDLVRDMKRRGTPGAMSIDTERERS